jgi:hypothetical protein
MEAAHHSVHEVMLYNALQQYSNISAHALCDWLILRVTGRECLLCRSQPLV